MSRGGHALRGSISALRGEGPRRGETGGEEGEGDKCPTSPSYLPVLPPESPLVQPPGLKFQNPELPSLELTLVQSRVRRAERDPGAPGGTLPVCV